MTHPDLFTPPAEPSPTPEWHEVRNYTRRIDLWEAVRGEALQGSDLNKEPESYE